MPVCRPTSIHAHCHLFVCARLCSFAGPCLSHLVALAGPHAYHCLFMSFAVCSSPFVCWPLFVPAHLRSLGCAGSCLVVLVPATWLHLFGFRLCSLVFIWVRLCWFSFCLCSFRLCHVHLCFDQVFWGSQASHFCLYQIYVST